MANELNHAIPALPPLGRLTINFRPVIGLQPCRQIRIVCQFQHASRWTSLSQRNITPDSGNQEAQIASWVSVHEVLRTRFARTGTESDFDIDSQILL